MKPHHWLALVGGGATTSTTSALFTGTTAGDGTPLVVVSILGLVLCTVSAYMLFRSIPTTSPAKAEAA